MPLRLGHHLGVRSRHRQPRHPLKLYPGTLLLPRDFLTLPAQFHALLLQQFRPRCQAFSLRRQAVLSLMKTFLMTLLGTALFAQLSPLSSNGSLQVVTTPIDVRSSFA